MNNKKAQPDEELEKEQPQESKEEELSTMERRLTGAYEEVEIFTEEIERLQKEITTQKK
jgi:hypothetical protein